MKPGKLRWFSLRLVFLAHVSRRSLPLRKGFEHQRGQGVMGIMATSGRNKGPQIAQQLGCAIVPPETNYAGKLRGDFEAMAKRRHQGPKPRREGNFWYIRIWEDSSAGGVHPKMQQPLPAGPNFVKMVIPMAQDGRNGYYKRSNSYQMMLLSSVGSVSTRKDVENGTNCSMRKEKTGLKQHHRTGSK